MADKEIVKSEVQRVRGPKKGTTYTRYYKTAAEKAAAEKRYSEYKSAFVKGILEGMKGSKKKEPSKLDKMAFDLFMAVGAAAWNKLTGKSKDKKKDASPLKAPRSGHEYGKKLPRTVKALENMFEK